MKKIKFELRIFAIVLLLVGLGCSSSHQTITVSNNEKMAFEQTKVDTIALVNAKTEYDILIIEPGFNFWLQSIAKPGGYYSQSYLENRNQIYVINWNQRAQLPSQYDPNLYEQTINYDSNIDYGYEVNYKLYNYFIYFQRKYNQRLGPWVPRI